MEVDLEYYDLIDCVKSTRAQANIRIVQKQELNKFKRENDVKKNGLVNESEEPSFEFKEEIKSKLEEFLKREREGEIVFENLEKKHRKFVHKVAESLLLYHRTDYKKRKLYIRKSKRKLFWGWFSFEKGKWVEGESIEGKIEKGESKIGFGEQIKLLTLNVLFELEGASGIITPINKRIKALFSFLRKKLFQLNFPQKTKSF